MPCHDGMSAGVGVMWVSEVAPVIAFSAAQASRNRISRASVVKCGPGRVLHFGLVTPFEPRQLSESVKPCLQVNVLSASL
jgi:hypothetical protein